MCFGSSWFRIGGSINPPFVQLAFHFENFGSFAFSVVWFRTSRFWVYRFLKICSDLGCFDGLMSSDFFAFFL